MATKSKKQIKNKSRTKSTRVSRPVSKMEYSPVEEVKSENKNNRVKYLIGTLAVLLLVVLYWYKTNSWPVVALVNNRPIFRSELNRAMYEQVGVQALDSLIMERLIDQELADKKVQVSDEEVNTKLDEIKAQIGSDESFQQALQIQGLTEDKLKEQFRLQLGLEKLVEPSTDSAVLQERIFNLVQELRDKAQIRQFGV